MHATYEISKSLDPRVMRRSRLKIFTKSNMAARSCDQAKYEGLGAQVLIGSNAPVKSQGFRCNGFPVLARQKSGGRRRKERRSLTKPIGAQAQLGLGP